MTMFNQQGQQVNYQYNAGGNINFGAVQNSADLAGELKKLRGELDQATAAAAVDREVATDVGYQLDKATQQAEKPTPDKDSLLDYLTTARDLVRDAGGAAGLLTGLAQAIQAAQGLF